MGKYISHTVTKCVTWCKGRGEQTTKVCAKGAFWGHLSKRYQERSHRQGEGRGRVVSVHLRQYPHLDQETRGHKEGLKPVWTRVRPEAVERHQQLHPHQGGRL
eukprot:7378233-Prymnesium_polylepis.1